MCVANNLTLIDLPLMIIRMENLPNALPPEQTEKKIYI